MKRDVRTREVALLLPFFALGTDTGLTGSDFESLPLFLQRSCVWGLETIGEQSRSLDSVIRSEPLLRTTPPCEAGVQQRGDGPRPGPTRQDLFKVNSRRVESKYKKFYPQEEKLLQPS